MVELRRVELLTPCLQSRCSDQLSYSPTGEFELSPNEVQDEAEDPVPSVALRSKAKKSEGGLLLSYKEQESIAPHRCGASP